MYFLTSSGVKQEFLFIYCPQLINFANLYEQDPFVNYIGIVTQLLLQQIQ